jgi:hypothetical protein
VRASGLTPYKGAMRITYHMLILVGPTAEVQSGLALEIMVVMVETRSSRAHEVHISLLESTVLHEAMSL